MTMTGTRTIIVALLASTGHAFVPSSTLTTGSQLNSLSLNDQDIVARSNLPGNFGFDPLHLAQTPKQLATYRKAEIKHARVAMLAVMAIMWSDFHVVDTIGATPFFEGRAFPEFLGACVGLPAALELYGERVEEEDNSDDTYFPGNLDLDPFHLYPASTDRQRQVQFAEIMAGRVCMLAAAGRLLQNMFVSLGMVAEDESFLSLLVPVQTTVEAMEEVVV